MMKGFRYFLQLSYRGTAYHGWQVQAGSQTVQETVENSLSVILQQQISTTGCGRTDTGVHARYFIAHFDSETELGLQKENLIFRLNRHLPDDIEVRAIHRVTRDAHARFDALFRTYEYHITRNKDPFMADLAWHRYGYLSVTDMNKACDILLKYNDFTSFSKLHSDVKTNNCRITHARWFITDTGYIFIIRSDRFLRNMVRAIVGTMINTGTGKLSISDFEHLIESKDRNNAGMSAPAKGLFLTLVEYPYSLSSPGKA
ncbi:MAG TPA: tRNA pseudouridine(38-40) synthase TruA [Bacteroidetes bacterium]|nr:tRNA pseudouridine(38-40) synthase TruA [Bacteroidota bacterium]